MVTRAQMLAAIEAADAVSRRIAAISASTDLKRRKELVEARRELALRTMELTALSDQYLPLKNNPALVAEGRRRFGVMRNAVVDHQVAWPAAAIDRDPAEFARASAIVHQYGRDFMDWFRQTVETLPEDTAAAAESDAAPR